MDNLAIWYLFLTVVGIYVVDDHDIEIVEFIQQFNSRVCHWRINLATNDGYDQCHIFNFLFFFNMGITNTDWLIIAFRYNQSALCAVNNIAFM